MQGNVVMITTTLIINDSVPLSHMQDYFVGAIHSVRKQGRQHLEFLVEWVGFPVLDDFTLELVKNLPSNIDMVVLAFKEQWIAQGKKWGGRHWKISRQNSD